MTALLVVSVAAVVVGLAGFALTRKRRCPGCNARALVMDMSRSGLGDGIDDKGVRYPFSFSTYQCGACNREWKSVNNGALITPEAYAAGAHEPPPVARVLPPKEPT